MRSVLGEGREAAAEISLSKVVSHNVSRMHKIYR
jgi:hypothetical protein